MFKTVSKDGTRTFASPLDPAIDDEAMTEQDWHSYQDAWRTPGADWRSYLKVKQGERLTEFVVGVLTAEELNTIIDETARVGGMRGEERYWRCFLAGLRDIRNWPDEPAREGGRVTAKWLRDTFVGPLRRVALSVGVAVLSFNQTTEEEIKNLSGRSRLKSATAALSVPSAMTISVPGVAVESQA